VSQFLAVDFVQICQQLGLEWQKVVGLPKDLVFEQSSKTRFKDAVDTLVKEVRQKCQEKIQNQCNIIQVLDIAQAVKLMGILEVLNAIPLLVI